MRRPSLPELDRYKAELDIRLRGQVGNQKRIIFPYALFRISHRLKALIKPFVQSGAMAMTALAVIIAMSATPAANTGDLVVPAETPLAAPSSEALRASDSQFPDLLPQDDVLAMQKADISDITLTWVE